MNIIITGASRGFGKAIAEQFAAHGHTLYLGARNIKGLNEAASSLRSHYPGSSIHTKANDLGNRSGVEDFGQWINDSKINVDILINNAGSYVPGSVHNEPNGSLEKMLDINLYSAYHLTRKLLPAMIEKKQGHIFTICSIASLQAYNNGGAYSISKFALLGFNKNLREEMKPYGIKVTSVIPGAAYTDSWIGSGVDPKRIMEASDIAKMIYASSQLSPQACPEEIILRPQLGDL
ncbi:MAG: SDR family oxidoreductase [Chitinophagaceae bacterium]